MDVAGAKVEAWLTLRARHNHTFDLVAPRHHVRKCGDPVGPLVELLEKEHHIGLLIHPRHGVEGVAHPRSSFRPRVPIIERLGRELYVIEHELELMERCHPSFRIKNHLPLHISAEPGAVNGRVPAAVVVVGHESLESLVREFEAVARPGACRLPAGVDCSKESAETTGSRGRALVPEEDRPAHVGGVVDDG